MYQETLKYYNLWRLAVQERDEARELLKHSLTELSQLQELFNTLLLSEEPTLQASDHQKCNYDHFFGDSPSSNLTVNSSPPVIYGSDCYSFRSNVVEKKRDFESLVLETIGGVLPENGKFLEVVSKANSLVESLFITGSVPKWRNPPVQLLSHRPVLSNGVTGNWNYGGSGILNRSLLGNTSQFSST